MPTRKKDSGENPPSESGPRVTRSRTRPNAGATVKVVPTNPPKRKTSDAPRKASAKRSRLNAEEAASGGGRDESTAPSTDTDAAGKVTKDPVTTTASKPTRRLAPQRPNLNLDSDGEEASPTPGSDGDGSHTDSEKCSDVDTPTAANLQEEFPVSLNVPTNGGGSGTTTRGRVRKQGGKKVDKVLNEVPVSGRPTHEQGSEEPINNAPTNNPPMDPLQPIHQEVYSAPGNVALSSSSNVAPSPNLAPAPPPLAHPLPPVWPVCTTLLINGSGRYSQSGQIPEIQACLGAAIRRSNSNLVFVDSFPEFVLKNEWLSSALKTELARHQNGGGVMQSVSDRAQRDGPYFGALLSMITHRWSGFRQGVIDMVRILVVSQESTYGLWRDPKTPDPDGIRQAAEKLLEKDAYQLGKTSTGAPNSAAPYQNPEMFAALVYFFKTPTSVGVMFHDSLPRGKYGFQVPDAMVALTATSIQVALEEIVAGGCSSDFTEVSYRKKYRSHLKTIESVKTYKDGDLKHARMMSKIYQATMDHVKNGRPTPEPPVGVTIDIENMEI